MRTASGATAVQLAQKFRGQRRIIEHLGSAHDEPSVAALVAAAEQRKTRLQGGEQLPLLDAQTLQPPAIPRRDSRPRMAGTVHRVLWEVLAGVYDQLGFSTAVDSEVFKKLVIARLIEPTSKLRSLQVLESLGLGAAPSYSTVKRHLGMAAEKKWRDAICTAAYEFAASEGPITVCLYDSTTLYFESDDEDGYRRPGFSKERRIDPQIVVGLLVDRAGFPLEIHSYPGNTAEATTIIPVLESFKTRHGIEDIVVVADAGMLSHKNCQALQEAGYQFIIASRVGKMPKGLEAHIEIHGNNFEDGWTTSIPEKLRADSTTTWRTVYHFSWKRFYRDRRSVNKQVQRAEDIANGRRSMAKARFVSVDGKNVSVNQDDIDRARQLQGLKGYVSSAPQEVLSNEEVVAHYHALFEVEASFRLAKHDLSARPMFHRIRTTIEAHLSIVFCALAISRHLQATTGHSLRRVLDTLRPLRDGILHHNGEQITIPAALTDEATEIINTLGLELD